jgi:hypothetical protein
MKEDKSCTICSTKGTLIWKCATADLTTKDGQALEEGADLVSSTAAGTC